MPESGSGAFFVVNLLMLQLRVFLGRKCRIYALFFVANIAITRFLGWNFWQKAFHDENFDFDTRKIRACWKFFQDLEEEEEKDGVEVKKNVLSSSIVKVKSSGSKAPGQCDYFQTYY